MFKQLVNKDNENIYPILSSQHETIPEWFIIYQEGLDTNKTFTSPLGNSYTIARDDIGARISKTTTVREVKVITDYNVLSTGSTLRINLFGPDSYKIHCPYACSTQNYIDYVSDENLPLKTGITLNQNLNIQAEYTATRIPKKDGSTDWVLQGHLSARGTLYSTTFNIWCHNNAGNDRMPRLTAATAIASDGYCIFEILEEI